MDLQTRDVRGRKGRRSRAQALDGKEPSLLVDRLQAEVVKAYADPATAEKLEKAGLNAVHFQDNEQAIPEIRAALA